MARVKRAVNAKKSRRQVLERAKGYYGNKSRSVRAANEQVMKSGQYAFRDRRARKGEQLGDRSPHDGASAHDHRPSSLQRDLVGAEQLQHRRRRGGKQRAVEIARGESRGVRRSGAIHVLGRVDRCHDVRTVDSARQRRLQDDPRNIGIVGESLQGCADLRVARRRCERDLLHREPCGRCLFQQLLGVDQRIDLFCGDDGGEHRRLPAASRQRLRELPPDVRDRSTHLADAAPRSTPSARSVAPRRHNRAEPARMASDRQ